MAHTTDPYRTMLASLLLALPITACKPTDPGTGCLQVADDATECPAAADVNKADLAGNCGSTIRSIDGEGTLSTGPIWEGDSGESTWCCYPVSETAPTCVYGRPYVDDGRAKLAEASDAPSWRSDQAPHLHALPAEARAALRDAWTEAALDEHAAVASFARVSLELLALGAPPDLVLATHAAAMDEVHHAQLGFGLASAFAAQPVGPGAFPLGDAVTLRRSLLDVAVAAAREGCIGETLTTLVATEALAATTDPATHAVLAAIVADEQRHAQLAWRTVAWALSAGDTRVHAAVAAVFDDLARNGIALPTRLAEGPHAGALVAHGVPSRAAAERAIARGIAEVVLPAARTLLDRSLHA